MYVLIKSLAIWMGGKSNKTRRRHSVNNNNNLYTDKPYTAYTHQCGVHANASSEATRWLIFCHVDDVWQTIFLNWMPFDVVIVRRHYIVVGFSHFFFHFVRAADFFSRDFWWHEAIMCVYLLKNVVAISSAGVISFCFVARYLFTAHLETVRFE